MRDADEPLDPELAALYAKERAMPLPDGATARVLAGVLGGVTASAAAVTASTAATSATSAASSGATGLSLGKVIAIAVASAIGGGTVAVVGYRELASPPAVQQPAPTPDREPHPDASSAIDANVEIDAPAEPAPRAIDRPRPAPPPDAAEDSPADDTREPLLIDRARAALRRGLIDEALATLMRHERIHPSGALAEERDVLIIEAYVAQKTTTLARRRIERYRREHPAGFLRARVDRAEAALAP